MMNLQPRGKCDLSIFLDLAKTFRLSICGDCITMAQKPEEQHSLYANNKGGKLHPEESQPPRKNLKATFIPVLPLRASTGNGSRR
jgi:hypothetical protein